MNPSAEVGRPVRRRGQAENGKPTDYSVWLFLGSAVCWVVIGCVLLAAAFDRTMLEHERLLLRPEAVFGIRTHTALSLFGVFHFLFGVGLLCVRDSTMKAVWLFWGISVCLIYRFGVSSLATAPLRFRVQNPIAVLTGAKLGLSAPVVEKVWLGLLLAMAVGAVLDLVFAWRRCKYAEDAAFMEHWRKSHEGKGRFPWAG